MKSTIIAAAAAFVLAGAGMAAAQDTIVITKEQQPVIQEYVVQQQVAPAEIPADYDLVVGSTMPDTIELHTLDVPDMPTQYEYVVVNGQTVLVDPQSRQVVQIIHE